MNPFNDKDNNLNVDKQLIKRTLPYQHKKDELVWITSIPFQRH
jgi:hypothetical protein